MHAVAYILKVVVRGGTIIHELFSMQAFSNYCVVTPYVQSARSAGLHAHQINDVRVIASART